MTRFSDMKLSDERLAAIEALGWEIPTPIQLKAIPAGLEGKDIVGIAQTENCVGLLEHHRHKRIHV